MNIVVPIINIIVFILFGVDKFMSKKKGSRIPEAVLLVLSFFFGAYGAVLGMILFNHKTNKTLFRVIVPLFAILNYVFILDSLNIVERFLTGLMEVFPK